MYGRWLLGARELGNQGLFRPQIIIIIIIIVIIIIIMATLIAFLLVAEKVVLAK